MISAFSLGVSSGFPLLLIGSTFQAWLVDSKLEIDRIGHLALIGLPYTFKFVLAPFMDRYPLPFLGRRRGWILSMQAALAALFFLLAEFDPATDLTIVASIGFCIALCSSMQDIVVDSYRRESLTDEELGLGSGLYINGYRIALLISGAFALAMADQFSWSFVYRLMGVIMGCFVFFTFLSPKEDAQIQGPKALKDAIVLPLVDFFKRKEAWTILLFVLLYKIGDSMASTMTTPFILKMGYSKTALAAVAKTFGMLATITGGFIGGYWATRWGLYRSLWIFGILQMLSTGVFPVLQYWQGELALSGVVAFENLASGMGTAAYTAFMASLTNRSYTAAQYALLTSLIGIPRTVFSSLTGDFVELTNWTVFFFFCMGIALPGLFVLHKIRSQVPAGIARKDTL